MVVHTIVLRIVVCLSFHEFNSCLNKFQYQGVVPALMIVQVELGSRGHKADSHSMGMTTHPMFTTVLVSESNSSQVFTEGLEDQLPRANRDAIH